MPTILLISDIHSNLPALDAVWSDAFNRATSIDETWVLGDSVGYGAQPNETIDRLRSMPGLLMVKGNHEAAVLDELLVSQFNSIAALAILWTAARLKSEVSEFLRNLPMVAQRYNVTLCHGSPRDPMWEYLTSPRIAMANLNHFQTAGCATGHSHIPLAIGFGRSTDPELIPATNRTAIEMEYDRWFVNPGSVGQPRDGDPRASYVLIRSYAAPSQRPTIEFHRVDYDVEAAQKLILDAGLHPFLATRLSDGR